MRKQLGTPPAGVYDAATVGWTQLHVVPRVTTIISSAVPIFNVDYPHTCLDITNLTEDITSMTTGMTGTPNNFWRLMVRIHTESAQHIAWGSAYLDSGVANLVRITQPGKTHEIGLEYNLAKGVWVCLAVDPIGA